MLRNIRWRIALPYILLVLAAMAVLTIYLGSLVRAEYAADLQAQLSSEARLSADALAGVAARGATAEELDALAKKWAGLLEARVTIIAADGIVLGDSHEERATMDNHLSRPEVQQALASRQGTATRLSDTLGYEMMYTAASATVGGKIVMIARVARPLRQVEIHTAQLRTGILLVALITSALAVLLAAVIAGPIVAPIRRLTREAIRMAEGDLSASVVPTTGDEIGKLGHAFNRMAAALQERMDAANEERRLLASVLSRMADGAIITDAAGLIQLINPAAARLLGVADGEMIGRPFAQVVREFRLVGLWRRSRERSEQLEETIEVYHPEILMRAIVTPLEDEGMGRSLTILQDLTRVRRLETVRRDFVSNVSHELRTPLASLKALVETLRDGALEDPQAARRFLDSAETEVDALAQMVQELLELSRAESGQAPLKLVPTDVYGLLSGPAERLRPQAERAGLTLEMNLPPGMPRVLADVERVQQVVVNLLHNAIKFTPPGGQVTLSAETVGGEVIASVKDTGVGIAAENLERIFERFYKADRARSGGGTGLGLAIAKHIVQAHGGRIWAESVEGRGSTFRFSLPAANRNVSET